jgi:hypothetical protein
MTKFFREPTVYKASVILAITVPLACMLSSIAWAIASYLMVREKLRAQVKQAHLEIERKRKDDSK